MRGKQTKHYVLNPTTGAPGEQTIQAIDIDAGPVCFYFKKSGANFDTYSVFNVAFDNLSFTSVPLDSFGADVLYKAADYHTFFMTTGQKFAAVMDSSGLDAQLDVWVIY